MAHLDLLEERADADMASLYWWRRDAAREDDTEEATPLADRLAVARRAGGTNDARRSSICPAIACVQTPRHGAPARLKR